jgi:hypothetical protein
VARDSYGDIRQTAGRRIGDRQVLESPRTYLSQPDRVQPPALLAKQLFLGVGTLAVCRNTQTCTVQIDSNRESIIHDLFLRFLSRRCPP